MMRVVVAMLASCTLASCGLVVTLDDLRGASDASTDAPVGVDAADAKSPPDTGTGEDAPADVGVDVDASTLDYAAAILGDAPLAYFHLDEVTGTTLEDASGNKHDATLVNGVSLGVGGAFTGSGTSIHFNGSGYVAINNSVNSNGTPFDFVDKAPFSVEAWVSIDVPATVNDGYTFFSKEQFLGGSSYLGFDIFVQPKFIMQREDDPTDETEVDCPSGLAAANTWYYLVGTYDGNAITVYVDSVAIGTLPGSLTSIPITNVPFLLGSEDAQYNSGLVGKMDEAAIYANALTPTQIAAHFHAAGKWRRNRREARGGTNGYAASHGAMGLVRGGFGDRRFVCARRVQLGWLERRRGCGSRQRRRERRREQR